MSLAIPPMTLTSVSVVAMLLSLHNEDVTERAYLTVAHPTSGIFAYTFDFLKYFELTSFLMTLAGWFSPFLEDQLVTSYHWPGICKLNAGTPSLVY